MEREWSCPVVNGDTRSSDLINVRVPMTFPFAMRGWTITDLMFFLN